MNRLPDWEGRDTWGTSPRVRPKRRNPTALLSVLPWVLVGLLPPGTVGAQTPPCSTEGVKVTSVEKAGGGTVVGRFVLNDRVRIHVDNVEALYQNPDCVPKIALLLNGRPVEGDDPVPTSQKGVIEFPLAITPKSRPVWNEILANALDGGWRREVSVGVGIIGHGALPQQDRFVIVMDLFPTTWTAVFALMLVGLAVCFVALARRTNLLRDPPPPADSVAVVNGLIDRTQAPPEVGSYSLARTQGAWWLAIILTSYVFIGVVTGDFASSFSSTAVVLLGIGFGTVMGGGVISQQKREDQLSQAKLLEERVTDLLDWNDLDRSRSTLGGLRLARYTVLSDKYPNLVSGPSVDAQVRRLSRDYAVATGQGSRSFLTDVLTDADGISFARFQLFAWTSVLGVVFVVSVLGSLVMPVFDTTLMGLLGLSSATYLGLKIPEATVPRQS